MNNEKHKLVASFLEKYINLKFPEIEIKKGKLFTCPFHNEHDGEEKEPTCKIYPSHGYKLKCLNPKHSGEDWNIFDVVKKTEQGLCDLSDNDLCEYLIHMLDIQTDDEADKCLRIYSNSGFNLIPLQPKSKNPIENISWKKTMSSQLSQWQEWYHNNLNLGIVLGKASNVVAIDIDHPTTLEKIKHMLGSTAMAHTSKGFHFIYNYDPSWMENINHINFRSKGYEMELRANNSYIVVAPSSVTGEKRYWNGKKIEQMSSELKEFLLSLIDKPKEQETEEVEKFNDMNLRGDLKGLDGRCNETFIKLGGVLSKSMPLKYVEKSLLSFNKLLDKPMPYKDVKSMMYQIKKYRNYDKQELMEDVYNHLKVVEQSTARDLQSSLNHEKKDIEEVLSFLVEEGKIIKNGHVYRITKKIEWQEDFISISKPLPFKVPYFNDYARFSDGSLVIIGAKTGTGKTTVVCNFLRKFKEQGIKPYLICTEADSKFGIISASLGLSVGDYYFTKIPDPTTVELEDNAVTIVDWISSPEDYSKVELMYRTLSEQLQKHGGLLIAMAQLKEDTSFYAQDMTKFYGSFIAKYLWTPIKDTKGTVYDWDSQHTYFKTEKIRDSKLNKQYLNIPTFYSLENKRLELRK